MIDSCQKFDRYIIIDFIFCLFLFLFVSTLCWFFALLKRFGRCGYSYLTNLFLFFVFCFLFCLFEFLLCNKNAFFETYKFFLLICICCFASKLFLFRFVYFIGYVVMDLHFFFLLSLLTIEDSFTIIFFVLFFFWIFQFLAKKKEVV